ncbi:MAG: DUF4430 domain-containing protein [Clostridia bacterium]|nr:DUF4430 domain-containing protein [Clostridia bacterium]
MLEFFKKHKTKIFIILAVVAVLAVAFFMGGNPDSPVQVETNTSSAISSVSDISKTENTDISKEISDFSSESKPKEKSYVSDNSSETSKNITSSSVTIDNQSTVSEEHSLYNSETENEVSTPTVSENPSKNSKNTSVTSYENSQPVKNENISDNQSSSTNSKTEYSNVIKENSKPTSSQPPTEKNTCTISISCATILDNMDKLKSSKKSLVSSDGWILKETTVTFKNGDTVFDVLKNTCTDRKIHLEFSKTPLYNSMYIEGINNIYEFDCGSASGWMYRINGTYNSYSCSEIKVKNGDNIQWLYTCNMGKDIDGYFQE